MNLGQVLAMMAQGQEPSRYSPPQTQSSAIPWQQIAAITPPNTEPVGFAKLPPVEVMASRLPALPEQMDPLSLYESEMYGGPLVPPQTGGMERTPGPSRSYGFAAPQPVASPLFPPLPIRGMMAQPQEVSSRIPKGMTDVPMQEPVAPEQPLAMMEQMPAEAQVAQAPAMQAPVEEPKKPVAPWKLGEPYKVATNEGEYTITGYDPKTIGKSPVRVTDPQGTVFRIEPDVDPEFYNQIVQGYNKQVEMSKPPAALGGFTSKIFVGQGDKGQWYDAKVDPATNRVIYKMGNRTAVYETPSTLKPGENFIGGTTDDDQNLVNIQQANAQILNPAIKRIQDAAQDMPRTPDKVKLRSGLSWELRPSEDIADPMPEIVFYYQDGINGPKLTLQQAEDQGLITPGTNMDLQNRKLQVDSMLAQRAKGIEAAIGSEAKTNFDREIDQIDKQNKLLAKEKASASPERVIAIEKIERKNQERKDALLQQSAVASTGAGGVTVIEGGTTEYKLPFDPNTLSGRLNMFTFEGFDTTGQIRGGTTSWSPDDYVNYIVDQAMPNIQVNPLITTSRYKAGIGALAQRVQNIQGMLNEKLGDQSREAVNDNSSIFQYRDSNGNVQEEQMSLNQALDEFQTAQTAYRNNPSQKNMDLFAKAARRLSGNMYIAGLGDEPITPSPAESILTNISSGFDMPVSISTRVPGTPVSPSGTLAVKPPPQDVVGARAPGARATTVTKVPAFPMIYVGVDPTLSPNGYAKFDASFNFFDRTAANANTYNQLSNRYQSGSASPGYVMSSIARATFSEDGNLNAQTKNALATTIDDINKEIAGDNGQDLRREFVNILYEQLDTLGGKPTGSASEMASDLEAIRALAKAGNSAGADVAVENFKNKWGRQITTNFRNNSDLFVRLQSGVGSDPGFYGSNISGRFAIESQLVGSLEDIAYLFKNSGYTGPAATRVDDRGQGNSTVVTWIPNLARNEAEQSVITLPIANTSPTRAQVKPDPRPFGQANANPLALTATTSGGQTVTIEPTTTLMLTNFSKVRNPISTLLDKLTRQTGLSAMEREAASKISTYRFNLAANSQIRRNEDEAVEITPATNEAVRKYVIGELLNYSMFPSNRVRTYSWMTR